MKNSEKIIIGIGGRVCNFIISAYTERFAGKKIKMALINTNFNSIKVYPSNIEKILIESNFSKDKINEINALFKSTKICYIISGLGGNAGSKLSPIVIDVAKQNGNIVMAFTTTPFEFEREKRRKVAEKSLALIKDKADIVINFSNQNLLSENVLSISLKELFIKEDENLLELIEIIDKKLYQYNFNFKIIKEKFIGRLTKI